MAVTSQGNRCSATMNLALSVLCVLLLGHCSGTDTADYSGSGEMSVMQGNPLFITCRVTEYEQIKWYLDGRTLTPGRGRDSAVRVTQVIGGGYIVSNLTVGSAQMENSGRYRCTAFVDNVYNVDVISANMINTNVDDTDRLRVLIDTDDVKLTCTADKLKGEFVWERSVEGSLPGPLPTDDRFKTKGGELTISEPTEMDAANYTCKFAVSNGASNLNATIQIVTNVTVRMTGKSINKQEGDDLTITCRAYGKPTPTITWTKNAKDIFTIYNITSRLTLGPNTDSVPQAQLGLRTLVRPDDAGDYCCHAENVANSASQCIIVRVKDKYGALWPFIGIVCEVVVLTAIIYIYEKKSKPDMDDSDTDHNNDRPAQSKGDVRQRK